MSNNQQTMKALVYTGEGVGYAVEERPVPKITEPGDVVVKVAKASICGTDLHILKGDVPTVEKGRILGHEGIGTVSSVGPNVHKFKEGDKVIISAVSACSMCEYCRRGMTGRCSDGGWILGHLIDGAQAEYVRIPHADTSLHHMLKDISDEEQVMASDVLPTGYECGVLNGRVTPGCTVAVIGGGPVGLGAMLTAELYTPAKLIMIDLDENRLKTAKELGATHVFKSDDSVVKNVMDLTGGIGVDTVIEAVGIPATFRLCQDIVAPGGTIANLGVHGKAVQLHLEDLWDKSITITTRVIDATTTPTLLKLVEAGKLKTAKLATHSFNFGKVNEAYETFGAASEHNALKMIIEF